MATTATSTGTGFVWLALVLLLYFLPSIVAATRKHRSVAAVAVLNALLGWTLIGWVAALVWALAYQPVQDHAAALDKAGPDLRDDLLTLFELHERGVLTDDEYAAAKAGLLG